MPESPESAYVPPKVWQWNKPNGGAFANINRPHDYYQLIITPFLAIAAAAGLRWLGARFSSKQPLLAGRAGLTAAMAMFLTVSILTYVWWLGLPQVDPRGVRFQELCAGKVEPGDPRTFEPIEPAIADRTFLQCQRSKFRQGQHIE